MQLLAFASVNEFFHEALARALRNQRLSADQEVEAYLVQLLSTYSATTPDDEPLGIKLAAAQVASPEERLRALRDVGDTSLYMSGFFADSLSRRMVDVDYYISLGGSAYGQLARTYERRHTAAGEVFDELGHRFGDYVEVLAEVSQTTSMSSPSGVVQLYERWLKTGSEWAERQLRRNGLVPPKRGEPQ
jgi:hypothetical protein